MQIRMIETRHGSEDGVRVGTFVAGQVYDLTGSAGAKTLARVFLEQGWAQDASALPAADPVEPPASELVSEGAEPAGSVSDGTSPSGPYSIKHAGGPKFEVVDSAGNSVSEKLPKAEAEAEAARLNGQP